MPLAERDYMRARTTPDAIPSARNFAIPQAARRPLAALAVIGVGAGLIAHGATLHGPDRTGTFGCTWIRLSDGYAMCERDGSAPSSVTEPSVTSPPNVPMTDWPHVRAPRIVRHHVAPAHHNNAPRVVVVTRTVTVAAPTTPPGAKNTTTTSTHATAMKGVATKCARKEISAAACQRDGFPFG